MVLCVYHPGTVQMFGCFSLCHASAFVLKRVITTYFIPEDVISMQWVGVVNSDPWW